MAAGCGILAKGPIIYLYALPVALLAPWWATSLPVSLWRWYGMTALGVALSLAIGLAWALPAAWQGGGDYAQAILFGQTAGRMVKAFDHQQPVYWYLLVLPLLLFPWSMYLPVWKGVFRSKKRPATRFLASILLPGFVLLSLVSGKQLHYLLPLLPTATILLAAGTLSMTQPGRVAQGIFYAFCLLVGLAVAALPFLPIHGNSETFFDMLPPWLGVVPLVSALPLLLAGKTDNRLSSTRVALASVLLFMGAHLAVATPLHLDFGAPKIFEAMTALDERRQPIHVYPPKLKDQFAFSARLTAPLVPLEPTVTPLQSITAKPDHALVWYIKKSELPALPRGTLVEVYKSGYLVLYPGKAASLVKLLAPQ